MATVQLSPRAVTDLEALLNHQAHRDLPDLHRPHDGLRGRAAVRLDVNARGETR